MNRDVVERVRRAIYDTFASQGHPLSRQQIRDLAAVDEAQVNEAIAELAAQRHLALDQSGNVVMAHPFTTVNLGFSVMGERTLWWGGCAWDSFAIPNLVKDEPSVLVATTCPACRRPLAWTVTRAGPPEGPEVAHFLVPMDKVWNDVVYACSNQRLFCSKGCVQDWLASTGHAHGYIMDLATLWRLASGWYSGRLDSPYQRKDPQGAADYFRGVGLHTNAQSVTAPGDMTYIGGNIEAADGVRTPRADVWLVRHGAVFALSSDARRRTLLPDGSDFASAGDEYGVAVIDCVREAG